MPFIPHSKSDVSEMLATIGVPNIETLFDEIPAGLRMGKLSGVPEGLNEQEITRLMLERAEQDGRPLCFMGAGAYDHHVPAAVWEITTPRRILQRLHALPGGSEPGHAAADL